MLNVVVFQAGNVGKALELAFRTRQFGALQHISESLDSRADPELLRRCASFFMENDQFDKAVDLLAIGKKVRDFPGRFFFVRFPLSGRPRSMESSSACTPPRV